MDKVIGVADGDIGGGRVRPAEDYFRGVGARKR